MHTFLLNFFLDGVSEGQFKQVLDMELPLLQGMLLALKEIYGYLLDHHRKLLARN